jgi:SulP family sulfate permease
VTAADWLHRLFPFLHWLRRIDGPSLRADSLAGLIGAIVVLPQGVAFATLAGLPPEYGLYAAMVPAAVAALWGSSWHLVSGPTNAISLVVLASLSPLAEPGTEPYIGLALTLTFMVGAMQLAMGLARLGTLVNFISHTVVVGFTAGAALLIMASQLKNAFGLALPRGLSFFQTLHQFALHLGETKPLVVLVAALTLVSGILARRFLPKLPYMIVAMIAGILAALALNLELGGAAATGITTIGALPGALPSFSAPLFQLDTLKHLMAAAAAVTVLGLTEAVSIARSVATKSGQRIDGNQEFIGQGLSNLVGSFFSAYPASGSFNRSGVNYEAGARTPLAAVFGALFLVAVLFLVAPLAAYLPHAAMAGVLFLVAWGLIDFHHIANIVRASRSETAVLAVSFGATLVTHLEFAILFGIALSLLLYLNRTARPKIRSLVPDANDPRRKFVERAPGQPECPQLKILRIEGSLYFGAVSYVGDYLAEIAERQPHRKHLLLMGRSMNFVDIAGAELLAQEAKSRHGRGGGLYFHSLREGACRMLRKAPYARAIGEGVMFARKREAIAAIYRRLDPDVCARCEVRIFEECAPGTRGPDTMLLPAREATPTAG